MMRAYQVYSEMNELRRAGKPFFMAKRHIGDGRLTRNQHGTQYRFTDGTRLTVSRRRPDDTNDVKSFDARGYCVAVMAMRLAIEPN